MKPDHFYYYIVLPLCSLMILTSIITVLWAIVDAVRWYWVAWKPQPPELPQSPWAGMNLSDDQVAQIEYEQALADPWNTVPNVIAEDCALAAQQPINHSKP